jgi:hypothetical protein
MIRLSGADLVLPGRVLGGGTVLLEGDRIAEIRPPDAGSSAHAIPPEGGSYGRKLREVTSAGR